VSIRCNTRAPIQQAAETPAQIQELFDGIAYGKAAAVLRMLEAYIGPESFGAGVKQYLKQHSYGNANGDGFWTTLAKVSGKPVDAVMPTFVQQAGLPLVAVRSECNGRVTQVTVRQQRYLFDRELFNREESKELWQIPVCLKEGGTAGAGKNLPSADGEGSALRSPWLRDWTLANAGLRVFYRSGYEAANVRTIAEDLETGLTPAERIMLRRCWLRPLGRQPVTGLPSATPRGLRVVETSRSHVMTRDAVAA